MFFNTIGRLIVLLVVIGLPLCGQTDTDSVMFDQAIQKQNVANKETLDVKNLMTDPGKELKDKKVEMPVLSTRLDTTVQRLGCRIVAGFWSFYVSDWWQITVRGILLMCAIYGIGYYAWLVMTDQMAAGKAYQTIFIKLTVTITVFLAVAPNIPFVLTKAINKLVLGTRYTYDDMQLVRLHQQAFMHRAIQFEAQAATTLDGRLDYQYYTANYMPIAGDRAESSLMDWLGLTTSSPLYSTSNPPKEGIAPLTTVDGESLRTITAQSFIFVGPPALGEKYQKMSSSLGRIILVAPPCPQPVYELRKYAAFIPFVDLDLQAAGSGAYSFTSPVDNTNVIVPKRPFAANVAAGVRLYENLTATWAKLGASGQEANRVEMLNKCDEIAETLLRTGWSTIANDIVNNQAFAFTPDLVAGPSKPVIQNPNIGGVMPSVSLEDSDATLAIKKQRDEQLKSFEEFYTQKSKAVADDLKSISGSAPNRWTTDYIIPIGLLFCNAYIIVAIWLLPPLLGLWASFFLLPPIFGEINNALKKGGAVIIALVLYPVILQFIILFCFALTEAAADYDTMLDPNRNLANAVVYGILPSANTVTGMAAKEGSSIMLLERFKQSNAGVMQLVAWFGVLAILVGSPAIVAKMIMGMGAADALAQPAQSGATMGASMATKSVMQGVTSVAGDAMATGASVARRFDRR